MRADYSLAQPGIAKNCGEPATLTATAEDYIRMASCYRVVHTDRLHFAIAAMIAGREARLYPNSYFKNEAMYHLWLKGRRCQRGGELPSQIDATRRAWTSTKPFPP